MSESNELTILRKALRNIAKVKEKKIRHIKFDYENDIFIDDEEEDEIGWYETDIYFLMYRGLLYGQLEIMNMNFYERCQQIELVEDFIRQNGWNRNV